MRLSPIVLLLAFLASSPAMGFELRFEPQSPLVGVGEGASISVFLDESIPVKSFDLTVEFDGEILESTGGDPGQIFQDTGCFIWWDLEDETAGRWHGFAVVMDAYCLAQGPGELFRWDLATLAEGYSRLDVEQVRLFDEEGHPIAGVELADIFVFVGGEITSVPEGEQSSSNWSLLKLLY